MITVEHIKAHLPFKNCQLTFMLRRKPKAPVTNHNEIKLTEEYVDIDINCVIQVGQFVHLKQIVELCTIAVTETDKICVGTVDVNLSSSIHSEKATLKGVVNQDGFLIYSYSNESQSDRNRSVKSLELSQKGNQEKSNTDQKNQSSRGFIKYKNSSSNSSPNDNNESPQSIQSKSRTDSPFKKNKIAQEIDIEDNPSQYHKLLAEVNHEILKEQLFNQRAWNKIQQNEIFQLRYNQRIQALLGNSLNNRLKS